jgi:chromatin remodeling complex protein RSC6
MPSKKSSSKMSASAAPSAEPVAPAPVVETPAPVVEGEVSEVPEVVVDKYAVVLEKLQLIANEVKDAIATVKVLQRENAKLVKQSTKKPKKAHAPRVLSGFAKPSQLSDELCDFMGVARGTSMARTEVTRAINEYIKTNSLQASEDKRTINPDEKLRKILNLGADDKLTYFNLQKYMKHHFTKDA